MTSTQTVEMTLSLHQWGDGNLHGTYFSLPTLSSSFSPLLLSTPPLLLRPFVISFSSDNLLLFLSFFSHPPFSFSSPPPPPLFLLECFIRRSLREKILRTKVISICFQVSSYLTCNFIQDNDANNMRKCSCTLRMRTSERAREKKGLVRTLTSFGGEGEPNNRAHLRRLFHSTNILFIYTL